MTLPACLSIGGRAEAVKLQPRGSGWEFDGAASCRAYGPDMTPPTEWPTGCAACVRRVRAEMILAGEIVAHPVGARAGDREADMQELADFGQTYQPEMYVDAKEGN